MGLYKFHFNKTCEEPESTRVYTGAGMDSKESIIVRELELERAEALSLRLITERVWGSTQSDCPESDGLVTSFLTQTWSPWP